MSAELPIEFFVAGEPKAQPRPRAFARRMGKKFVARVYDAGTAEAWKSLIAEAAKPFVTGTPISGPVKLEVAFLFGRPKYHYGTGRNAGVIKASAPVWHTTTPDCDNLVKAVKDCLTQIGLWSDDCIVCLESVSKRYAGNGSRQGAGITITPIG